MSCSKLHLTDYYLQHVFFFFFNDTATTEIYTLSLHDALPIYAVNCRDGRATCRLTVGSDSLTVSPSKMDKEKFAIGIDYGTESGRVVVVRVRNGEEAGAAVIPYPDGVIDEKIPGGPRLEPDWALQNPRDYLLVVEKGIPRALKAAGVRPGAVAGIGTDFTASTPLPTKADGTPLCFLPEHRKQPHAWVKLWKHHAAQPEANRINEIGREDRKSTRLNSSHGYISYAVFCLKKKKSTC